VPVSVLATRRHVTRKSGGAAADVARTLARASLLGTAFASAFRQGGARAVARDGLNRWRCGRGAVRGSGVINDVMASTRSSTLPHPTSGHDGSVRSGSVKGRPCSRRCRTAQVVDLTQIHRPARRGRRRFLARAACLPWCRGGAVVVAVVDPAFGNGPGGWAARSSWARMDASFVAGTNGSFARRSAAIGSSSVRAWPSIPGALGGSAVRVQFQRGPRNGLRAGRRRKIAEAGSTPRTSGSGAPELCPPLLAISTEQHGGGFRERCAWFTVEPLRQYHHDTIFRGAGWFPDDAVVEGGPGCETPACGDLRRRPPG